MKIKRFRKLVFLLHRWLGLLSGLIVFVVAVSGSIYCWAPEMRRFAYKQDVEEQDRPFATVDDLRKSALQAVPKGDFRTVYFRGGQRTAEVLIYAPGTYYIAQLNPYSAELAHIQDMNTGAIQFVLGLHRRLKMGDFGREVVHWATLSYLLMWTSGLLMRRVGRRRGLRRWHDLIGYYGSFVALIAVLTGLFWGFGLSKSIAKSLTGENQREYEQPLSTLPHGIEAPKWGAGAFELMERLAILFREDYPDRHIRIASPHKAEEPVLVSVHSPGMTVRSVDHFYFDRYTGEALQGNFHPGRRAEASPYHALEQNVYDWHLGTWLGFPTRLAMCLSSLAVAWLPLSGFLLWWRGFRRRS